MAPEVIKGDPYTDRADIWYVMHASTGFAVGVLVLQWCVIAGYMA